MHRCSISCITGILQGSIVKLKVIHLLTVSCSRIPHRMQCSRGSCLLPCGLQEDGYFSLQFFVEKYDEGSTVSFLCVYFLDLFNKVNFPFSLVVADGFSELCLASEAN